MTLYELTDSMRNFELEIDEETGEIVNADELDELEMERTEKLKNCVRYYKNVKAEADALKAEKAKLANRQKSAEKRAEWIKDYIAMNLNGEPFAPEDDPTIKCGWRKSETVECENVFDVPEEFLTYKEPVLDKTKVRKAINAGETVSGCRLVEKQNLQIK